MKSLICVILISQIGCVSRSFLNDNTPNATIDSLNSANKNRSAKILMTDGNEYYSKVTFGIDSAAVKMDDNNRTNTYKNSSIRSVTYRNNKAAGAVLGFFAGATVAGLCDIFFEGGRGFATIGLGIGFAPIGAVIGAVASKHKFVYEESIDPLETKVLWLEPSAILIETGTDIKIQYNGRQKWIKKSLIKIKKYGNSIEIRMKQLTYAKLFGF
ncbi:hypothetical protein F9K33_06505 [bacterium]|nr:MAG: hypothetical protein F9K33_06505 [bacterium]